MLPSFYASADGARPWSLTWAAAYGAGIGALAAVTVWTTLMALLFYGTRGGYDDIRMTPDQDRL